jgi:hypothetical protein
MGKARELHPARNLVEVQLKLNYKAIIEINWRNPQLFGNFFEKSINIWKLTTHIFIIHRSKRKSHEKCKKCF